jgi:hypothetical protein
MFHSGPARIRTETLSLMRSAMTYLATGPVIQQIEMLSALAENEFILQCGS